MGYEFVHCNEEELKKGRYKNRAMKCIYFENEALKYIPEDCLKNCCDLWSVEFNHNIINILDGAFENCISLDEIKFPSRVEDIGAYAFMNCISLKEVHINDCKCISPKAFNNCFRLEKVFINKCDCIHKEAFKWCDNLKEIHINKDCDIREGAIPEGVEVIYNEEESIEATIEEATIENEAAIA